MMSDTPNTTSSRTSRWIYLAGVAIFIAYALWMIGPYLRSIVVRDAAVTSWSNTATAPIAGIVHFLPLQVGSAVDDDGIVARISNDHLSQKDLSEEKIKLDFLRAQITEWNIFLEEIKQLDEGRAVLKSQYAEVFRNQLDTHIQNLSREIEVTSRQLDLVRKIAARTETLARQGTVAQSAEDEALLRVAELELNVARLKTGLANAEVRRAPADQGVFISLAGEDPDWVRGSRMELKLQKKQARLELRRTEAELRQAESEYADRKRDFERQSKADIVVPAESLIWSRRVAPGAAVVLGNPILEWLDCSVLMIDVPVSDAEVSLVGIGMIAEVILEGEVSVRHAPVLMTRGSAATLGRNDLAAVAKGRHITGAQVLLDFSAHTNSFKSCPVGRAAYVNFPNIGLIDVVRARLRL